MRVAVYYNNHDIRIEERPIPKIDKEEVLIQVKACGICGSDVMGWYRRGPTVLGHEIGGVIVEVGGEVKGYKEGDRVSAAHHVPCNLCHYCLSGHHTVCDTLLYGTHFDPGGFSEYLRLPKINVEGGLYHLPDEISLEEATFIEPLACVVRAQRLACMRIGKSVLVIGCGIAGLLHIQLAKTLGASSIIGVDPHKNRLHWAKTLGVDVAISPDEELEEILREKNKGLLADLVIICTTSKDGFIKGLNLVERGGVVLLFAPTMEDEPIPLLVNELFWRREVTLVSSYGGAKADHLAALELIRTHRIKVKELITHRLPLGEIEKGFRLVEEKKDCLKVIIEPQR